MASRPYHPFLVPNQNPSLINRPHPGTMHSTSRPRLRHGFDPVTVMPSSSSSCRVADPPAPKRRERSHAGASMQAMEQRRRDEEEEEGRRQAARGGSVRRRRRRGRGGRRVPGGDEDREAQLRRPEPERPGAAGAGRRRVPLLLPQHPARQRLGDEQARVPVSTRDDAPAPGLVRAQARGERSLRPGRQVVARMEGPEAALGRRLHCIHDPRLHRPTARQSGEQGMWAAPAEDSTDDLPESGCGGSDRGEQAPTGRHAG